MGDQCPPSPEDQPLTFSPAVQRSPSAATTDDVNSRGSSALKVNHFQTFFFLKER